jgi:hypothetical protein
LEESAQQSDALSNCAAVVAGTSNAEGSELLLV